MLKICKVHHQKCTKINRCTFSFIVDLLNTDRSVIFSLDRLLSCIEHKTRRLVCCQICCIYIHQSSFTIINVHKYSYSCSKCQCYSSCKISNQCPYSCSKYQCYNSYKISINSLQEQAIKHTYIQFNAYSGST